MENTASSRLAVCHTAAQPSDVSVYETRMEVMRRMCQDVRIPVMKLSIGALVYCKCRLWVASGTIHGKYCKAECHHAAENCIPSIVGRCVAGKNEGLLTFCSRGL
jgi:hypothetical protein